MSESEPKKAKFAPKHKAKENDTSEPVDVNNNGSSSGRGAAKSKDAKPKFQRLSKGPKNSNFRENIERVPFYRPIVEKKPTKGKTKNTAVDDSTETAEEFVQEVGKKTKAGKNGTPSSSTLDNEGQGGVNKDTIEEFDIYVTSDEEDDDVEMNTNDDSTFVEEWPRKRYAHNQTPLMLPIGPRTVASRSRDLQRSIIDPFSDKEELLLMQLPSELALLPQTRTDGEEGGPLTEPGVPIPSGKLGKMQVMESGKVVFVTESGVKYDVSNGMPCYFLQCLAIMDLPKVCEDESVSSSTQPSGGEFGVVGTIKRKLVVSHSDDSIGQVVEEFAESASL